ncbi:hypothetical protein ACS0TY_031820 [Phlomoides rotata]
MDFESHTVEDDDVEIVNSGAPSETVGDGDEDEAENVKIRTRAATSDVWSIFSKPINGKVKCGQCEKEYIWSGSSYGTSTLKRHLNACKNNPKYKDVGQMLDGEGKLRPKKIDQNHVRQLISMAIISHDLPLSFVEYHWVRELLKYLNPDVKSFGRLTANTDVLKLYEVEKIVPSPIPSPHLPIPLHSPSIPPITSPRLPLPRLPPTPFDQPRLPPPPLQCHVPSFTRYPPPSSVCTHCIFFQSMPIVTALSARYLSPSSVCTRRIFSSPSLNAVGILDQAVNFSSCGDLHLLNRLLVSSLLVANIEVSDLSVPPLSLFSRISTASGVISTIVLLLCLFFVGTVDGVGFHHSSKLINWSGILPFSAGTVMSLIGSVFSVCYDNSRIMFPENYWNENASSMQIMLSSGIVALGIVCATTGAYNSVLDLANQYR